MSTTPANSYMITNRNDPTSIFVPQRPIAGDTLWWYMATQGTNVQDHLSFENQSDAASTTPPSSFSSAIQAQLAAQETPSLTILIHGLDCDWSSAVKYTGLLGENLAAAGGYPGLVVGFSWPSMGKLDLIEYSNGYPPAATDGTARGNIACSVASFGSLIAWTRSLAASVSGLRVSFVCHSEGNYLMMLGMAAQSGVALDQVIMLAADINDAAFQKPASGLVGQAQNVATQSTRTTIYSSKNDSILQDSITHFGKYHNPSYSGRLGLSGPDYAAGAQQPHACGVDCSAVVNAAYVAGLPPGIVPARTELHLTYFYIPQILQDITQTLAGTAAGSITHRAATSYPSSYTMTAVEPVVESSG